MKFLLIAILFCSTAAYSQTISPVISEAKGPRVRGEFSVTNNSIVPLAVYIEPQNLIANSGKLLALHLDPGTNILLTDSSIKLGPRQSWTVGYQITCTAMPCVVNFGTTFSGLHSQGLAVALHLGSVVYVCSDKSKGCRERIRVGWGVK